jgi:flagellar protein FlaG
VKRATAQAGEFMNFEPQQDIRIINGDDYREGYANSVQVRVNVWDFFMIFGTLQPAADHVEVRNFQGIYLSPQQSKALASMLQQNVANYEQTFGDIKIDPKMTGQVH